MIRLSKVIEDARRAGPGDSVLQSEFRAAARQYRPSQGARDRHSLRNIAKRQERLAAGTSMTLLVFNTYLLDGVLWGIVGGKPERRARSQEIGRLLVSLADDPPHGLIALLTEVFDDSEQNRIVYPFRDSRRWWGSDFRTASTGHSADLVGSGLMAVVTTPARVVDSQSHTYEERGSGGDADQFSSKGVLRLRVEFRFSTHSRASVAFYLTHLLAGGGLPFSNLNDESPPRERSPQRFKQVDELVGFIERTRREDETLIVAGDFNIIADDDAPVALYGDSKPAYGHLMDRLSTLGLYDVWARGSGTAGFTGDVLAQPDICVPGNSQRCSERLSNSRRSARAYRIDYIFSQRRAERNLYAELEFTQPERLSTHRRFRPTGLSNRSRLPFLSDHLPIVAELRVGPPA